jgi:hypothetical protein
LADVQRDVLRPSASDVVVVTVSASDNSALASVTLHYDAGAGEVQVAMFDDGASGDGGAGDEVYGGAIPSFVTDTVVDYWVSATDDLGSTSIEPLPAPAVTFTYVVGYSPPPLAINEFMADNVSVIEDPDEPLAFEDWIEIYNAGDQTVWLDGMYLTDRLLDPTKFALPNGLSVPAEGYLLLWADSEPLQGIDHLGFRLAVAGEEIGLFDTDLRGNAPIDTVSFGVQAMDIAEALCPDGFHLLESTANASPGDPNLGSFDCLIGSHVSLYGTAQGGEIRITIEGTLVVLVTLAGQSAEEVAIALADAITLDPTLSSAGVSASALGSQVAINATVDSFVIDDPGFGPTPTPTPTATATPTPTPTPEPGVMLQLVSGAVGLAWLNKRRRRSPAGQGRLS